MSKESDDFKFCKFVGFLPFHENMFDIHLSCDEPLAERKNQIVYVLDNYWRYLQLIQCLTSEKLPKNKIETANFIMSSELEAIEIHAHNEKHFQRLVQKHSPESFEFFNKKMVWVSVNQKANVIHMRISNMQIPNMSFDGTKFALNCKPGYGSNSARVIRTVTEKFSTDLLKELNKKKK
jgi:hypothetical protein